MKTFSIIRTTVRLWSTALALLLAVAGPSLVVAQAVITVDPSVRYQTMTGWEVTPRGWEQDKTNDRYDPSFVDAMPAIADLLVNQLGINRVRLEIWSGTENPTDYVQQFIDGSLSYTGVKSHRYESFNDNNDPAVADLSKFQFTHLDWQIEQIAQPMDALLRAKGERLWMNFVYVDFGFGSEAGPLSHADNPDEYAELISVTFQHLKNKYGIIPDSFEVILEPDNSTAWQTGMEDKIAACLVAAVTRLNAEGFYPQITVPSAADVRKSISVFDQLVADAKVRSMIGAISYHRYAGAGPGTAGQIGQRTQTYGIQSGMSEKTGAGFKTLVEDLKYGQVSFWQQWGVADKNRDRNLFYCWADFSGGATPVLNLSSTSRVLQQYFHYIRIGDTRIGATSSDGVQFDPVAFVDKRGRPTVVVKYASASSFAVRGLPAGTYGVSFSNTAGKSHVLKSSITIADGEDLVTSGVSTDGAITIFPESVGGGGSPGDIPASVVFEGGVARFRFESEAGVAYAIRYSVDMTTFTTVATVTGTGSVYEYVFAAAPALGFYVVEPLP